MRYTLCMLLLGSGLVGCGDSKPEKTTPTGSFEVKVSRSEVELPATGSVELPVEVVWTRPPTAEVALDAQVEPASRGVTATLNPAAVEASGGMVTLIVKADRNATGQYQVRVQGKCGPRSHTATLRIVIMH
jgi:hypothetical protein